MQHNFLQGISAETRMRMSDGTRIFLCFTHEHIHELCDVDFALLKKFYVQQRALFLQKQGDPHFVTHAFADADRTRKYYYDNHLAGNI